MEEENADEKNTKKPRKSVPRKKLVKKKKERGKYKPKGQPVGMCDVDVTECIFSDDEIGAGFIEKHKSVMVSEGLTEQESVDASNDGSESLSSTDVPSPSPTSLTSEFSNESRPESAASSVNFDSSTASRPDLSCELECSIDLPSDSSTSSRPSSSQSHHPRPSLSASCDIHLMLGATDPPNNLQDCKPSTDIIVRVLQAFKDILSSAWTAIAKQESIHLLLLSVKSPTAIQREIILKFNGVVSINVHCQPFLSGKVLTLNEVPMLDNVNKVSGFCVSGLKIVKMIMDYDICVGANHQQTSSVWALIPDTVIDRNPYKEESYTQTCRSTSCHWLVKIEKGRSARCPSCTHVMKTLRKRENSLLSESPHPFTPNIHLTLPQALNKMKELHEEIKKKDKKN